MDSIIEELLGIEKIANQIVHDTEEKKKNLTSELDRLEQEISVRIEKETQDKIQKMQRALETDSVKIVTEVKKISQQRVAQLEHSYQENHDQWVQELFNEILGR